ncbi:MAG: hypothetical protein HAW66_00895, partial [Shewanella sp.]|nr:hypothetical protein [Shewanella sp.]
FDEENKFVRQNEINVKSAQNYLSKDSSAVISPTNLQELSSADDDDSYGSLSVREEFNPITYEELLDIARENHLITQSSWCEYAQIENQKISMQTIRLPVSISSCFYVRGWSLKIFFDSVRTVEEKVKLTGKRDKENETLLSCEAHKEIAKQCIKKNCRGWIAFAKKHNEKVNKRVLVDKRVPQYFKLNGEWKGWDDFWGKK